MSSPRVVVVGDLLYDLLAQVESVAFGTDTFAPGLTSPPGSPGSA
jgi:hypothetical protein